VQNIQTYSALRDLNSEKNSNSGSVISIPFEYQTGLFPEGEISLMVYDATISVDVDSNGIISADVDATGIISADADANGIVSADVDATGIISAEVDANGIISVEVDVDGKFNTNGVPIGGC